MEPNEIDLVYLWVDGNDPKWQAKRHLHDSDNAERDASADCKGRYADNDELKYSLRAVEKNAPWIRKIFIVTDNQKPDWLDTSNPKIQIVDHKEIMPEEALPCFNSSLIEHFLYRIPGLSEHFLFSNDDMYINRPVTPSTFFAPDGLPYIRLRRVRLERLSLALRRILSRKPLSNYKRIVHNSALLVERTYGKYYSCKSHHNVDAYLKSDFQRVEEMYKDEIEKMYANHTRQEKDLQRTLFSYVALAEKRCHPIYIGKNESFNGKIHRKDHYPRIEENQPTFFCLNDSQYADDDDRRAAKQFMEKHFPEKSSFEL